MSKLVAVREAAETLNVSPSQVYRLLDAGQLRGTRLGAQRVVFAESLNEFKLIRPSAGRPLSPSASWNLIVRAKPRRIEELGPIASAARRRAQAHYCHILPYQRSDVAASNLIVLSGASGAAHHGAAIGAEDPLQVYVKAANWTQVRSKYHVSEATDDMNLIARVVDNEAWPFNAGTHIAPLIVCAVDAYATADLRSAHEALEAMQPARDKGSRKS